MTTLYYVHGRAWRVYEHARAWAQSTATATGQRVALLVRGHGLPAYVLETLNP